MSTTFKVGDWVIVHLYRDEEYVKLVHKITNVITFPPDTVRYKFAENDWFDVYDNELPDNVFHWQPEDGDWVISMKEEDVFEVYHYKSMANPRPCEPFFGQLPSTIKDK